MRSIDHEQADYEWDDMIVQFKAAMRHGLRNDHKSGAVKCDVREVNITFHADELIPTWVEVCGEWEAAGGEIVESCKVVFRLDKAEFKCVNGRNQFQARYSVDSWEDGL